MSRTRKNKLKRKRRIPKSQAPGRRHTLGTGISARSQVEGVPPTDSLKRHPDEAYGDTEIPHRGRALAR